MSGGNTYETDSQGRLGVHGVGGAVTEFGWIFREHPTSDFGIDGHIEIVEGKPTGRLIAVQIKSGLSYFAECTATGIVYRGTLRHLEYWTNHSLPVIIVLYHPQQKICVWAHVCEANIIKTESAWKIEIPVNQVLDASSKEALRRIGDGSDYDRRLSVLVLARPWMQLLEEGHRLFLKSEEWVNKTSGRGSLKLLVRREDEDEDETVTEWPFVMFPMTSYSEVFPRLFPWADICIDEEFYELHERSEWDAETGIPDNEEGGYIIHTKSYSEWASTLPAIRPYAVEADEVAEYRLELTLNELGRAFLLLDDYLFSGRVMRQEVDEWDAQEPGDAEDDDDLLGSEDESNRER